VKPFGRRAHVTNLVPSVEEAMAGRRGARKKILAAHDDSDEQHCKVT
jgi:hypothetical protein